jgi:hypothetical protein
MDVLVKMLGESRSYKLYLDEIEENLLRRYPNPYDESMEKKYVVAEIYSGRDHLYQPAVWMRRYVDQGRKILSVCLDVGYREGLGRYLKRLGVQADPSQKFSVDPADYTLKFMRFYTDPDMVSFATRLKLREVRVDVKAKDPLTIAEEIITQLRSVST